MMLRYALFCSALLPIAANAIVVYGSIQHPTCGMSNGCITANVSGGTGPYTWVWSPVPANGQGTPNPCGLTAGTWSVIVTDALADEATRTFTLEEQLDGSVIGTWVYDGSAAHHACPGQTNGSIRVMTNLLTGTPPYSVSVSGMSEIGVDGGTGEPVFGYHGAWDQMNMIEISVMDATGCVGYGQMINDSPNLVQSYLSAMEPVCGGTANGSAELVYGYAGPYGPFVRVTDPFGAVIFEDTPSWEPLVLTGLVGGEYTVFRAYSDTYFEGCGFQDFFTIPDLGVDCGTISGTSWYDSDADCAFDPNEVPIPFSTLTIQPGDHQVITDVDGTYHYAIVNGNYTLAQNDATLDPVCPPVVPVPFTMATNAQTIDLANGSTVPLDLVLTGSQGVARPGFNYGAWFSVSNTSPQVSGPISVVYTFHPQLIYTSASPTPSSVVGNAITWELPALGSFGSVSLSAALSVPAALPLGTALSSGSVATNTLPELSTANNSATFNTIVVGSYDPNDKVATTSSGASEELYFIDADEWINYTIRFQNTGTDTAFTVVVTDTLSDNLDMASFQQGAASHPFHVAFKPGRVVQWTFEDILLPDSNVNEMASHGLVGFRLKPLEPLVPGTVIENIANIFFDYNDPVVTDPSILTAEFSTGLPELHANGLSISPNPAKDHVVLSVADQGVIAEVRLFSADGRMLGQHLKTLDRVELDLDGLAAGTYLVAVRTNGGNWLQGHFAKE